MSVKSRKNVIEELSFDIISIENNHPNVLRTVSPTSGKVYTIKLTPIKTDHYGFGTTCQDNAGNDCKGNVNHVCKHSLAAVLHRIKSQDKMLYKCDTYKDAVRLNNILKGNVIEIRSENGVAWGVVAEKCSHPNEQVRTWFTGSILNHQCDKCGKTWQTTSNGCPVGRLAHNVSIMRDTDKFID